MKNVQRQIEEAETRFDRAKELYLIGELCRDRFEAERIRKEDIAGHLRSIQPNAILSRIDTIRQHVDQWDRILPIEKKRLLRLALETVFIRDNALWEINPTVAYLSVLPVLSRGRENRGVAAGTTGMVQSSSKIRGTGFYPITYQAN